MPAEHLEPIARALHHEAVALVSPRGVNRGAEARVFTFEMARAQTEEQR